MKFINALLCLGAALMGSGYSAESREGLRYDWPLFTYNFGGLDKYSIEEQVNMLQRHGYAGLAVDIGNDTKLAEFDRYRAAAQKADRFKLYAAFYRFNYDEKTGISRDWVRVVDRLAGTGTDLWLISGKPQAGLTSELLEREIRAVVDYAATKSLKVTLYPHSKNVISTAEEALVYVEKINRTNLDLAVHTCHEIRAGNAGRIEEVLEKVKSRLGYVTIAGSDNIPSQTNGSEWEYSTLKPLYRGNFNLARVLKKLRSLDYRGAIGFINHRITEAPDIYLPLSKSTYDQWIQDLNALPSRPFDAPDQCVWHAPSRTWFVSNLGGGISLAKDAYGWITRLDEKGEVIEPFWIGLAERMHAPSGMVATDRHLYVCDREGVHQIDITQRKIANFYPIPQGKFINDIAIADNGDLYVSDFFANRIYRLPQESRVAEVWLETDRLEAPDGLYMDAGKLIVGSWGVLTGPDTFNTSKRGDLLKIDLKTKQIEVLSKEAGNLEGITKAGDFYYVTDWAAGKLLKIHAETGQVSEALAGLRNPTDPGYAPELGVLAFPQHTGDQVVFMRVESVVAQEGKIPRVEKVAGKTSH
jgi:sugar phosphate isomerase/epimerase